MADGARGAGASGARPWRIRRDRVPPPDTSPPGAPDHARAGGTGVLDADFAGYVARRWPVVVRTAYLVCGDRAASEDLAQGAFVQLHRHWRRVSAQGTPDAYVHRIVVNLAIRHARKRRREIPDDQPPDGASDGGFARVEQRDELWRALRQLPPRMRAVLVLRFYEHLSERETAEMLDCAVGTVKSHTAQGLARLRALLDDAAVSPRRPDAEQR